MHLFLLTNFSALLFKEEVVLPSEAAAYESHLFLMMWLFLWVNRPQVWFSWLTLLRVIHSVVLIFLCCCGQRSHDRSVDFTFIDILHNIWRLFALRSWSAFCPKVLTHFFKWNQFVKILPSGWNNIAYFSPGWGVWRKHFSKLVKRKGFAFLEKPQPCLLIVWYVLFVLSMVCPWSSGG